LIVPSVHGAIWSERENMTAAVVSTGRWLAADGDPKRAIVRVLGFAIVLAGGIALFRESLIALLNAIAVNAALKPALVATLATAGTTAVGALPVLFARRISGKTEASLLGFGAGVMLAATAFSLLVPGIAAATDLTSSRLASVTLVSVATALGALLMLALDRVLPHEHFIKGVEGARGKELKRIWLFVGAITLHNLPEGLAVGVGFGGGDIASGVPLAVGIAVQNIPEGLVVAVALAAARYSPIYAVSIAAVTGLVEPIGGLFGAGAIGLSQPMLPWGMGFAAGAMLYVVSHEIIPESHRKGHEHHATVGLMAGFILMMSLDTALA
jgi:ZIP family zinc transporter